MLSVHKQEFVKYFHVSPFNHLRKGYQQMDKRTIKTKRNLKLTLAKMLASQPFEKITVSQLCAIGETSRITFYTYYEDKYALAEDIFEDFVSEAVEDYHRLQGLNNAGNESMGGYMNMLDCILNLYYNHIDFFSETTSSKNPYLYSCFYRHIFRSVQDYVERHRKNIIPKYSAKQTAALLCNGLWGVINECYDSTKHPDAMRKAVTDMYTDILMSDIFIHC